MDNLKRSGIESAAVAFLHAYKNPAHEQEFKRFLEKGGISYISASAELSPLIKLLERTETARRTLQDSLDVVPAGCTVDVDLFRSNHEFNFSVQ